MPVTVHTLQLSTFLSLVDVLDFDNTYSKDITEESYFGMPLSVIVAAEQRLRGPATRAISYFSMEYGMGSSFYNTFHSQRPLDPRNKIQEHEVFSNYRLADYFFTLQTDAIIDLPIYSGGLGVLAGDTIKTMADYKLPAVAIGMLWHAGYFRQRFWFKYGQAPEEMRWDYASYPGLVPLKTIVKIALKSEEVSLRLWKYYAYSYKQDCAVPLILLDANVDQNSPRNRQLTDQLYRSDNAWIKIMQRIILGMGGVAALDELGYQVGTYHLNEGHAACAYLEKARRSPGVPSDQLKQQFVYTCHTPVEAGHDRFAPEDTRRILPKEDADLLESFGLDQHGMVNLTLFAMNTSSLTNAVSRNHQKVMHIQFPKYKDVVRYVTNGVHAHTWISAPFMKLYEKYAGHLGDIKANPMALAKVSELREVAEFRRDVWEAHQQNKQHLCDIFGKWGLKSDVLTVCWARRVAAYKRPSLILRDVQRLIALSKEVGPLQVIFAGKAHPKDNLGFTYINEMLDTIDSLASSYDTLKVLMLENYEMYLAKMLVSCVDVWLNNPLPPFEASGTSGMKAILNGVIQLSTFDGWVAEVPVGGVGRIFGYTNPPGSLGNEHELHIDDDSQALYANLADVARLYYQAQAGGAIDVSSSWIDMMISCISWGSRFNTYRMLDEYKHDVWKVP